MCVRESKSHHEKSPGRVEDRETICRGAYTPMHFNRSGNIKGSVVKSLDLINGSLSVWRISEDPTFTIKELKDVLCLFAKAGETLAEILGPSAGYLRAYRVAGVTGQVFCIVDDCSTDAAGGYHPSHATLGLHESIQISENSPEFISIKEGLVAILKAHSLWKLSSP
jgi:hypothetical protein